MAAPTLDELAANAKLLRQEIAALRHELRRVRDGIERNPSHKLERRAKQLNENIAMCERDLARNLEDSAKIQPSAE